ncbi:MAG: glycosyltransferase family 39 protein [Cyanobacteria bacterium REEB459]|nr:glycosyltransferase family 39 protein [Cyanobacteria bacterium REEB459]
MIRWLADKSFWSPTVLAILVGGLVYRTIVAIWLPVGFDEAYYYLYSRYLHWSYFDHPAMVALVTGVGWWLTGIISPLTIRLGALGLYCLSLLLLYRSACHLYSLAVGQMTLALASLIPLFTIGFGILTSPDNGLILFWSATLLVALQEFFPRSGTATDWQPYTPSWRIALLGLVVGLACLSKYHGFILGLSLVGFCLSCRPYRRALLSPWVLAALAVFILSLFPLWYWNSQHDWISFRFQLGMRFDRDSSSSHFNLLQMLVYWLVSNAYLFPLFGLPLWWVVMDKTGRLLAATCRSQGSQQSYPLALLLWLSLPIMLLFTVLGGKQQVFPAWPAPGYWGATILLAAQAVAWQQQRPQWVRRWLWGSGGFLALLSLLALLHINQGLFQKPNSYVPWAGLMPVKQDGSTELLDILQLRRSLQHHPALQRVLPEIGFVFTNQYYLGGYLAMALHPLAAMPVTAFSQDPRGFAFWFNQSQWLGQDALFMTLERFASQPGGLDPYRPLFRDIQPLTTIPLYRAGQVTETIHIFWARDFRQQYPYPYGTG